MIRHVRGQEVSLLVDSRKERGEDNFTPQAMKNEWKTDLILTYCR